MTILWCLFLKFSNGFHHAKKVISPNIEYLMNVHSFVCPHTRCDFGRPSRLSTAAKTFTFKFSNLNLVEAAIMIQTRSSMSTIWNMPEGIRFWLSLKHRKKAPPWTPKILSIKKPPEFRKKLSNSKFVKVTKKRWKLWLFWLPFSASPMPSSSPAPEDADAQRKTQGELRPL